MLVPVAQITRSGVCAYRWNNSAERGGRDFHRRVRPTVMAPERPCRSILRYPAARGLSDRVQAEVGEGRSCSSRNYFDTNAELDRKRWSSGAGAGREEAPTRFGVERVGNMPPRAGVDTIRPTVRDPAGISKSSSTCEHRWSRPHTRPAVAISQAGLRIPITTTSICRG